MRKAREPVRGLGIPTGGGLVVHPDGSAEAVRRPVTELAFSEDGGEIRESLLLPPGEAGDADDRADGAVDGDGPVN